METMQHDVAVQTAKAAPAVAGTAYTWFTLNEWVAIATIFYIVVQIYILIDRHIAYKRDRKKDK